MNLFMIWSKSWIYRNYDIHIIAIKINVRETKYFGMGENQMNSCFRFHVHLPDKNIKSTTTPTITRGDVNTIMEILHRKQKTVFF